MFAQPGRLGMGVGRLGLGAGAQTLVAQALAILAKYGSASNLYLPGVGAINGITAGNWLDTVGGTPATVDGAVGTVVNAQGGANLTQSTSANKPILRRGLVNLLTYSHDFGNAVWPPQFTRTLSAGIGPGGSDAWTITGTTTAGVFVRAYTATSTTLSIAGVYKSGPWNPNSGFLIRNSTTSKNLTAAVTTVDLGNGWTLRTLTASAGISVGDIMAMYYGAATLVPNGQFWYLQSTAVFDGAVTAQQIIDAGSIPLTTTAPASSPNGQFAWQWDGSNDSFTSTLTPGNAGFFCSGAQVNDSGVLRTLLGAGAGSDASSGVWLARNASNALALQVGNGTTRNSIGAPYPVATNAVASAGWDSSAMFVGINNTETSGAKSVDCTSANTMNLGVLTGTTNPMLGTISGGAIIMPTVLPDATERATLRKFIASLSGVTM